MALKKKPGKAASSGKDAPDELEKTATFESAIADLEKMVQKLEDDDLSLDEALLCFERGIGLMRICDERLNRVRGKITELLRGEDGEFIEKTLGKTLESFLNEEDKDG